MKKIAIVDDEQDILDILNRFLKRSDKFAIQTFSNPVTALASIERNSFDLVLLDIMMPQMDGTEVLKKIKENAPSTKVIMMTAFSTQDKMIDCQKLGAEDYVTKPFISLMDVENKVLDLLNL